MLGLGFDVQLQNYQFTHLPNPARPNFFRSPDPAQRDHPITRFPIYPITKFSAPTILNEPQREQNSRYRAHNGLKALLQSGSSAEFVVGLAALSFGFVSGFGGLALETVL